MKKPAFEQLREGDILDTGDTRWNRLVQLAESDRRERVAEALRALCYEAQSTLVRLARKYL